MGTPKRTPHVQKMLDSIAKQARYYEDVPKHWMSDDHGMENALVAYVEELEKTNKELTRDLKKAKKETERAIEVAVAASNDAERALREADFEV